MALPRRKDVNEIRAATEPGDDYCTFGQRCDESTVVLGSAGDKDTRPRLEDSTSVGQS